LNDRRGFPGPSVAALESEHATNRWDNPRDDAGFGGFEFRCDRRDDGRELRPRRRASRARAGRGQIDFRNIFGAEAILLGRDQSRRRAHRQEARHQKQETKEVKIRHDNGRKMIADAV
jgi:hypothetical protein